MFADLGIVLIAIWAITGIFILTVTMTLELMICFKCRKKWLRVLPILSGSAISAPAMYMMRGLGATLGGIPMEWVILGVAAVLSSLGSGFGYLLYRKNRN